VIGETLARIDPARRSEAPSGTHLPAAYFALDDYPVHVTATLLGELKGVRAITEVRQPL
jgi:hypothetical protein